ncbi:MAG: heme ABC exporter ATP-binding protein CcmA [Acidobacteriota bacterium]
MAGESVILSAEGLDKRFGHFRALSDLSIELREGELLLLLGPNGAGKTTLGKVLTTLSRPSRGRLLFRGEPLGEKNRPRLRQAIGYLSHQSLLYGHLSAEENLLFFGRLYGIGRLQERVAELLREVDLEEARGRLVGTFSRGMQQRLSLARVLLTDPSLLILDEPYAGLDPEGSRTLTHLLARLKAASRAILLVTHELEDCLPIADRLAILHRGRLAWSGEASGLSLEEARRVYFQATAEEARP